MTRVRLAGLSILAAAAAACSTETPANNPAVAGTEITPGSQTTPAAPTGNFEADLATYDLSMDKLRRYTKASKEMTGIVEADPSVGASMNMSGESDFNSVAAQMEKHPRIRRALSNAGISAREFMLVQLAYMQAATGLALSEGNVQGPAVPGVNMKNVAFLRANKAQIDPLMREAGMVR